ncbi:hypothetical protein EON67_09225 [archaeon]|nr:MAG: hypothetical protein EON67_09225 [archaeon]
MRARVREGERGCAQKNVGRRPAGRTVSKQMLSMISRFSSADNPFFLFAILCLVTPYVGLAVFVHRACADKRPWLRADLSRVPIV